MEETKETLFVWMLCGKLESEVFIGFDHVRRTSKTYTSQDAKRMIELTDKISKDKKLTKIIEYEHDNF